MNLIKKAAGDALTIALEGRLDTTTSPQLDNEVDVSLEGVKDLTLDLHLFGRSSRAAESAEKDERLPRRDARDRSKRQHHGDLRDHRFLRDPHDRIIQEFL